MKSYHFISATKIIIRINLPDECVCDPNDLEYKTIYIRKRMLLCSKLYNNRDRSTILRIYSI